MCEFFSNHNSAKLSVCQNCAQLQAIPTQQLEWQPATSRILPRHDVTKPEAWIHCKCMKFVNISLVHLHLFPTYKTKHRYKDVPKAWFWNTLEFGF